MVIYIYICIGTWYGRLTSKAAQKSALGKLLYCRLFADDVDDAAVMCACTLSAVILFVVNLENQPDGGRGASPTSRASHTLRFVLCYHQ